MSFLAIARALPATLDWAILFRLAAIRVWVDDVAVRQMFFLPDDIDLKPYAYVVLSSQGPLLGLRDGGRLIDALTRRPYAGEKKDETLWSRFEGRLAHEDIDRLDCLGLGQMSPHAPVALQVRIDPESGWGKAQAVFDTVPVEENYEFLAAVGVHFDGCDARDGCFVAGFRIHLPTHLHAGRLSSWSRADNCTLFFLQQGNVDVPVRLGLCQAGRHRVVDGHERSLHAAARLAEQALVVSTPMMCEPPPPAQPYPYGDLAPLGLLLCALRGSQNLACSDAHRRLREHVLRQAQGDLWSFHSGQLPTSTDSALVLLGLTSSEARQSLLAIEAFVDAKGAYVPQFCAERNSRSHMLCTAENQHWCQADYGTTAAIQGIKAASDRASATTHKYLAEGFEQRGSLFFANPYFLDWALSTAIGQSPELRVRLLTEIIASMRDDYSFGCYDVAFSTALAALCLATLDYRGRTLRLVQLRLLDFMQQDGLWPEAAPFYMSLQTSRNEVTPNRLFNRLMSNPRLLIANINEGSFELSLFVDRHRVVTTAVAVLALAERCTSTVEDMEPHGAVRGPACHARYRCRTAAEYIASFALPPYI